MKKIIVSVAVAAIALSTAASALEDIKVNGQAKVWYETDNKGNGTRELFDTKAASGEVVFKLGMTGKQGDVGFGATVYQGSTMGLEGNLVNAVRTDANELSNTSGNADMFVGEAYITAPVAPDTVLKLGKQELDTPLAFTEKWNAMPNTFNAAVAINSSVENVTLIGAYVGQGNAAATSTGTAGWKATDNFGQYHGGAFALAALYSADGLGVNFWAYHINNVLGAGALAGGGVSAEAAWLDAGMKIADVNVKGYAAHVTHDGTGATGTSAFAASADTKVSDIALFAAVSGVSSGDIPVANTATGFKKTKLPTAGVYTDGLYVAQPGAQSVKVKASGKLGETGITLQAVYNDNRGDKGQVMGITNGFKAEAMKTTEIDLIVSQKVGAFDLKGILMNRSFDDTAAENAAGGQYFRVIASVNF
ncbi:hypothetical protein KKG72_01935 [bacterium]|nr:hypothetical protein [bacterium]MBU1993238.1 hypothetical protein [bacterium]